MNPALLMNLIQRMAQARQAQGGGAPSPQMGGMGGGMMGGGPPGMGGEEAAPNPNMGDQLASQLSELRGADPNMALNTLTSVNGMLATLYGKFAMTAPRVTAQIGKARDYLNKAIEEARTAAVTLQSAQPPANQAGIPNPQAVTGMSPGGMNG